MPSLAFKQRSGVARGYYGDQLTRGLSIFPREQWLWLEFRAMLADFSGTLDQLTGFLGVDAYHRHPEPGRLMSGPDRVVGTAPTAADLASLAQLYAADLAQFRAVSKLAHRRLADRPDPLGPDVTRRPGRAVRRPGRGPPRCAGPRRDQSRLTCPPLVERRARSLVTEAAVTSVAVRSFVTGLARLLNSDGHGLAKKFGEIQ